MGGEHQLEFVLAYLFLSSRRRSLRKPLRRSPFIQQQLYYKITKLLHLLSFVTSTLFVFYRYDSRRETLKQPQPYPKVWVFRLSRPQGIESFWDSRPQGLESSDSADPKTLSLLTQPTPRLWFFWLNGHYRSGPVRPGNTTAAAESSAFLIAHFKFITVLLCCMTRSYAGWLFKICVCVLIGTNTLGGEHQLKFVLVYLFLS